MKPSFFLQKLSNQHFAPLVGVPCSLFGSLFQEAERDSAIKYIAATSEGEAIGIASGCYLAGSFPVVLMQNSGLGNAINPLTSLNLVYEIPLLLLVSLRGEPGVPDAPEHTIMGPITEKMLRLIGIDYEFLDGSPTYLEEQLERAYKKIVKTNKPFALIVKKGIFEPCHSPGVGKDDLLSRYEAIKTALFALKANEAIVSTTGMISRELYDIRKDNSNDFYMIGSMGCASSVALGVALQEKNKKVVIFDGDGALLMKMGTLATIGHYKPANLIHILFDNESYESTGGQKTVSSTVQFSQVAQNVGYMTSVFVKGKNEITSAVINALKTSRGPHFIHIKVLNGTLNDVKRVAHTPTEIRDNFKEVLK